VVAAIIPSVLKVFILLLLHHSPSQCVNSRKQFRCILDEDQNPSQKRNALCQLQTSPYAGWAVYNSAASAQRTSLCRSPHKRAVEPQDREPTPAGRGLNPVAALHTAGLRRAEVDRRWPIGVRFGGRRRITVLGVVIAGGIFAEDSGGRLSLRLSGHGEAGESQCEDCASVNAGRA